ncbi:hypothetical protein [Hyphomonas atlantica corrig.]|uniref:hypothetical protein n=1 Tax=Hyphomonas atlantica TaxID=1280948 RepID=UPI0023544B85|nr:hypothetical protein [Hyphomonas atlantica]
MPQVEDERSPLKLINILRRESRAWFKIAGMIGIVFYSLITMTNWLKNTFDLDVLPFFEPVLDSFQAWSHWVLDIKLFRWLELLSGFIIDVVQSVWAMTFKTEIDLPELIVPSWWKDASILSFLLLRSQNGAVSLASPVSLHRMTVEEQHEWSTVRAQSNRLGRRMKRYCGPQLWLCFQSRVS